MKKIYHLILPAIILCCFGCSSSQYVTDVNKDESIILQKNSSQGNVHSLDIVGSGTINGTADIILMLNDEPYKVEHLTNSVHFQWGGDWYSDEATVIYKPISTTGGTLKLEYKFHSF